MAEDPYAQIAKPVASDDPYAAIAKGPSVGQSFNETPRIPSKPIASVSPAPSGVVPWIGNAEDDLRLGGGRTLVGRTLGHLQGRGDKGYSGLQSGVSPATAEFMGSAPLGITHALKGGAEMEEGHPIQGAKDVISGGMQASTIPSMMVGGPAADLAINAVPSAKFAGRTLEDIRNAAADVNVNPQNAWPEISRYQELTSRGGSTAKPVTQISKRLQNTIRDPAAGPLKFPEARDFYSNISSQSAEDASRLNPVMRRQMGGIRSGLHQDLTDAAQTIGRGQDYSDAIREYAQAMNMKNGIKTAAKYAIPAAVGGGLASRYLSTLVPK